MSALELPRRQRNERKRQRWNPAAKAGEAPVDAEPSGPVRGIHSRAGATVVALMMVFRQQQIALTGAGQYSLLSSS